MIQKHVVGPLFTNAYIIIDDKKAAIIDPGGVEILQHASNLIQEEITIQYIIITHGHFDHISHAHELQQMTKAKIITHPELPQVVKIFQPIAKTWGFELKAELTPDIVVRNNDTIKLNKTELKAIHTPGHSPDSITLYNEQEKYAITGDTIFNQSIGRTDFPLGNHSQLIKTIKEKILTLPEQVKLLPGHGEETTVKKEKKENPFLNPNY